MIVEESRELIATYLKTTFTKAKIGVGGNSTSPLAENLDVEIQSVSTVNSASNSNAIDFKFTIVGASVVGYVIRELGIFNADYSKMLTRINFDGIGPFASGEDVDFFVTIEVE
tara:strand:+ start:273 stop:611 length:339 start_codon:yes stop_codon:yes gene_type:complete